MKLANKVTMKMKMINEISSRKRNFKNFYYDSSRNEDEAHVRTYIQYMETSVYILFPIMMDWIISLP